MNNQRMADAYDQIAAAFAATHSAMPMNLIALGERFLTFAKPGARILDLGCGAGRDMAWLAGQGVRVVGADLSRGMLKEARIHTRSPLARMDLRRLSFGDGQFGGVWCNAALLHIPKAEVPSALREICRVLLPGGILLLGLQAGDDEGWEPLPYSPVERFFARYARAEAENLIQQAGFSIRHAEITAGGSRTWLQFLATAPTN